MHIRRPATDEILRIQDRDGRFYFSNAAELVLRKLGLLHWDHEVEQDRPKIVLRGCAPSAISGAANAPMLLEGPLDESTLARLGITHTDHLAESITTRNPSGATQVFQYGQFKVRRIPKDSAAAKKSPDDYEPFDFEPADPRWNTRSFGFQTFEVPEGWTTLLTTEIDGSTAAIAIRNENCIVLGFPLIDAVAFECAFPPMEQAGYYCMTQSLNTGGWDDWLLLQLRELLDRPGVTRFEMDPWPDGHGSAFTIRHDLDRNISKGERDRVLEIYDELDVFSTWFLLKRTTSRAFATPIADSGHELALHVEAIDEQTFSRLAADFEKEIGHPPSGCTAHGGRGSPGYMGHKHHQWARDTGMTYGEMLGRNNRFPHAAVILHEDIPTTEWNLVLPVIHNSLDAGMKPEQHYLDEARQGVENYIARGEHAVLMNHPDIHVDELEILLRSLDLSDTWCATMAEIAEWTRTSHCLPDVSKAADSEFTIAFPERLSNGATIRVTRDGRTETSTLPRGTKEARVSSDGDCRTVDAEIHLEDYFKDIRKVLMSSHVEKKLPRESIHTSIITNCDRLASRANAISKMIPIEPGDTIAELGCGYGFLAIGLHKTSGAKINGFDVSEPYLALGNGLLDRNPELREHVSFDRHDYLAEPLPESAFDVVLLNNTLHYIVGRGNQMKAMRNIYQSLKPGGRLFTFQPNRWYPVESFTKLPFVHWLPRRIGTRWTRSLGKRTMMDLQYISPLWMRRMLQKTGCREIRYWPNSKPAGSVSTRTRLLCNFFGMTAVKPIGNEGG
jgi:SAM-dependent methyltransferase